MPYDLNGDAYEEEGYPAWWAILLAVVILLGIAIGFESCTKETPKPSHDALTGTLMTDGQYIYWYVMVDPDTGIEYLVNNFGGTTPRLGADGRPILIDSYSS